MERNAASSSQKKRKKDDDIEHENKKIKSNGDKPHGFRDSRYQTKSDLQLALQNQLKIFVGEKFKEKQVYSIIKGMKPTVVTFNEKKSFISISFQTTQELEEALVRFHSHKEDLTKRIKFNEANLDPLYETTKGDIEKCIKTNFEGEIIVVEKEEDVSAAISKLLYGKQVTEVTPADEMMLGFDIEYRPCYRKGEYSKVSMLQLGNAEVVALFRLHLLSKTNLRYHTSENDLPQELVALLKCPHIKKVGVGAKPDAVKLQKDFNFKVAGVHDVHDIPLSQRCKPKSLEGLSVLFLGVRPDKSSTLTNWERDLTDKQLLYAATDAYCSYEIYRKISALDYTPVIEVVKSKLKKLKKSE